MAVRRRLITPEDADLSRSFLGGGRSDRRGGRSGGRHRRRRRRARQSEHELAAAAAGILHGYRATVRFHDRPDNSQSHARAGANRTGMEAVEDVLPLLRWNADPVIAYADDGFALPALTSKVDMAPVLRVPKGVIQ